MGFIVWVQTFRCSRVLAQTELWGVWPIYNVGLFCHVFLKGWGWNFVFWAVYCSKEMDRTACMVAKRCLGRKMGMVWKKTRSLGKAFIFNIAALPNHENCVLSQDFRSEARRVCVWTKLKEYKSLTFYSKLIPRYFIELEAQVIGKMLWHWGITANSPHMTLFWASQHIRGVTSGVALYWKYESGKVAEQHELDPSVMMGSTFTFWWWSQVEKSREWWLWEYDIRKSYS